MAQYRQLVCGSLLGKKWSPSKKDTQLRFEWAEERPFQVGKSHKQKLSGETNQSNSEDKE